MGRKEPHSTDQEEAERERESQPEDASVDQTLLLLHSKSSLRETEKLQDLLMLQDQEDLDQRESAASDKPSPLERRMTQLNMLLEEKSKLERRPDTSHQTFKDSSQPPD